MRARSFRLSRSAASPRSGCQRIVTNTVFGGAARICRSRGVCVCACRFALSRSPDGARRKRVFATVTVPVATGEMGSSTCSSSFSSRPVPPASPSPAASPPRLHAQETTSTISGSVLADGAAVAGATVEVRRYADRLDLDHDDHAVGRVHRPGIRAGDPYTVTVTAPGYTNAQITDIVPVASQTYNLPIGYWPNAATSIVVTATRLAGAGNGQPGPGHRAGDRADPECRLGQP